ncbi:MAG TPA: hypothetical protein PLK77_09685 [Pyrinomonadaceae bacterium]|nr:hypothetical protein [Pyrinomonadaceae bacterium]
MSTIINIDKIGSATSPTGINGKIVSVTSDRRHASVGDVVAVRALSESVTYGNLELPSGRLAKINTGDVLLGVLGERRALKGFVGIVPETVAAGDRLNLLNMGGVIGECQGHHSSLSDAIGVEVLGTVCDADGFAISIQDKALAPSDSLRLTAPLVVVAGTCMNSGKTVAGIEIVRQAVNSGYRVAAAKLTGVACLRDTLNMEDHGAFATTSFLDCGLPSTVNRDDLTPMAKGLLNHLDSKGPDLIVVELGDGIVGGYGVESILQDAEIKSAISSFVFCASDYVGVIGGVEVLRDLGLTIDVVAGSVTDSAMGEEFVASRFGLKAGNARRDGKRLFELVASAFKTEAAFA